LRVDADLLRKLIRDVFAAVPVSEEHATLIGELMVDTDLRGVVTHGIIQVKRYYSDFRSGATNTHPDVRVLREAAGTVALTGDGGLGYIAGHKAMAMAIDKARKTGIGAATTTYHEHIGSAGKYAHGDAPEHDRFLFLRPQPAPLRSCCNGQQLGGYGADGLRYSCRTRSS
jgi:LDH2 family malate/lactate/ureidoglycolate dehydrogenase